MRKCYLKILGVSFDFSFIVLMNLKSIVKVVIFAVFVYSYYYSYSHQFEEASITVEVPVEAIFHL